MPSKRRQKKKKKDGRSRSAGKRRKVDGNYKIKIKSKPRTQTQQQQKQKEWEIYSLNGCPYCSMAKGELEKRNIPHKYIEFEKLSDGEKEQIIDRMNAVQPGFNTYPRIFNSDGVFIGGYSNLLSHLKN
jgi:glutaredoxin